MQKRLVLINVGVVIIGLIAAALLAMPLVRNLYLEEFHRTLDSAVMLLTTDGDEIQEDPEAFVQRKREALQQAGQDIRLTVITLDGQVIGETSKDNPTGINPENENHLGRPEVQVALQSGVGFDTRKSESTGETYLYEARVLEDYVLRAAMPVTEMDEATRKLSLFMLAGVCLGGAIVAVVSVVSSRNIVRPMLRLTEATRKVAAGDFESRVPEHYPNEIGQLAQSFNRMADQTQKAFSELTEQGHQLEAVLQGMDDGVLAVDQYDNILLFNERVKALLQNSGLKIGEKLAGSIVLSQLAGYLREALETDSVVRKEIKLSNPERIMTVYAAPLNAEDAKDGGLLVLSDVTEVRKLQQLRSEFVANVTHELKTPLTSIRGFIELLKSGDRDEETRQYFYDVLDIEAERLHHLIDDMLVLSQIENAKDDVQTVPCNLNQEIETVLQRAKPIAEKNGIVLRLEAEEAFLVASSPTRLQQLFGNLVENAIKYNKPQGRVTVTLQHQRNMVLVKVKDTGIGIPQEHLPRLFERFYRVDSSRSREIGGTGLGLSIVKHLAGLYHGDVSVESVLGEGSVFTVRLPLLEG